MLLVLALIPINEVKAEELGTVWTGEYHFTENAEFADRITIKGAATIIVDPEVEVVMQKGIMTYTCPLCHATKTEEFPEKEFIAPATGDENILLWSLLLSGSVMSMMILRKKLHHSYSN